MNPPPRESAASGLKHRRLGIEVFVLGSPHKPFASFDLARLASLGV